MPSSLLASLLVMPHVPMLYVRVRSVYVLYSLIRPPSLTFCLRNQNVIILKNAIAACCIHLCTSRWSPSREPCAFMFLHASSPLSSTLSDSIHSLLPQVRALLWHHFSISCMPIFCVIQGTMYSMCMYVQCRKKIVRISTPPSTLHALQANQLEAETLIVTTWPATVYTVHLMCYMYLVCIL